MPLLQDQMHLQDQMQVIQQDSISAILTDTSAQVGGPVQIEDPVLLSRIESSNCFSAGDPAK